MRKLFIALTLLMLLAVGAAILLVLNAGSVVRAFQPKLESQLSSLSGFSLQLGELDLTLFPTPQVVSKNPVIQSGNGEGINISAQKIIFYPKLLPLLRKNLVIEELLLEAPSVRIQPRNADSSLRTNAGVATKPQEDGSGFSLALRKIRLSGGALSLESDRKYSLENIEAAGEVAKEGDAYTLRNTTMNALFQSNTPFQLKTSRISMEEGGKWRADSTTLSLPFGEISFRGNFPGEIEVIGNNINIPTTLRQAAALGIPIPVPGDVAGTAGLDLSLTCSAATACRSEGSLELKEVAVKSPLANLRSIAGSVQLTLNDDVQLLASENISMLLKDSNTPLTLSGSFNLKEKEGKLHLKSDSLSTEALEFSFPTVAPLFAPYSPNGELKQLRGTVELSDNKITSARGSFSLRQLSATAPLTGEKERIPFLADGPLEIQWGKSSGISIKGSGLRVSTKQPPANLDLALDISQPPGGKPVGKVKLQTDELPLLLISHFSPALKEFIQGGTLFGNISLQLRGSKPFTASGTAQLSNTSLTLPSAPLIHSLNLDVSLATLSGGKQRFRMQKLSGTIGNQPFSGAFHLTLEPRDLHFDEIAIDVFGGKLTGHAKTQLPSSGSRYVMSFSGAELNAQRALEAARPVLADKFTGNIHSFSLGGRGRREHFWPPDQGKSSLTLIDGLLKDVNLARLLLEKIGRVPLIGGSLINKLPDEFAPYFENKNTPIQKMKIQSRFHNGNVVIEDLSAASDVYGVNGTGELAKNGQFRFRGTLTFDRPLSEALVRKVKELRVLLNHRGYLQIPFDASGILPDVQVLPDIEEALKKGAVNIIGDQLLDLLGKSQRRGEQASQ